MPCRTRLRRSSAPCARLALALAFTTVTACEERPGAGASDAPSPRAAAAARYEDELSGIDTELARLRDRVGRDPDFWPAQEELARTLLDRGRLTGSFDDYEAAVRAAAAAERRGGPDGPCATRIRVALAVHRLAVAREALRRCQQRIPLSSKDRPELASLQAEWSFQAGLYDDSLRLSRSLLAQRESPADLARLALHHAATGTPVEALALLDRAEKLDHAGTPRLRAWIALQRGLIALHRGRWEEALAHDLAAERQVAGWWLVEEHIAEARALLGQKAAAADIYRRLLARVDDPGVMDALAVLLRELGRADEAGDWIARAEAGHRRRLGQLPEAAVGHALHHFLRFAPAAPETLALARRNAQLRGNGDARVALVRALLAAGRIAEAEWEIRAVRSTAWSTAETHVVAHQAFRRAGKSGDAQSEAALAASMNPRWQAQYAWEP